MKSTSGMRVKNSTIKKVVEKQKQGDLEKDPTVLLQTMFNDLDEILNSVAVSIQALSSRMSAVEAWIQGRDASASVGEGD
jgi:hypothetical protein